jgi:hypothetical protein
MRLRTLGAVCVTSAVAAPLPAHVAVASAQVSAAWPVTPVITPPGDLHTGAISLLSDRHVHYARRHGRLQGDRLTPAERRALRQRLVLLTPIGLRVQTRELREDIRSLRRKLERKVQRERHGGAPDVAIPAALAAIAGCESGGDPRAISPGGEYRGKYQFSLQTWRSVGGTGDPAAASETEQDRRGAILYRTGGPGHWPVCGR